MFAIFYWSLILPGDWFLFSVLVHVFIFLQNFHNFPRIFSRFFPSAFIYSSRNQKICEVYVDGKVTREEKTLYHQTNSFKQHWRTCLNINLVILRPLWNLNVQKNIFPFQKKIISQGDHFYKESISLKNVGRFLPRKNV